MSTYSSALSPSRAKDFKQCPLKFRYLVVDRLPQPPTEATIRGTVTHAVLEEMFALPPQDRIASNAAQLVAPVTARLIDESSWDVVLNEGYPAQKLEQDVRALVDGYFNIEQPQYIHPKSLETMYETVLPSSGLRIRGIIDRLDVSDTGDLRVTDYKTGKTPSARYMEDSLFQMRFYALLLRNVLKAPRRLQLLYLRGEDVLTYDPPEEDIDRFEQDLNALWARLHESLLSGVFEPRKSPLCPWCPFQDRCSLFGGTVTAPDPENLQRVLSMDTMTA